MNDTPTVTTVDLGSINENSSITITQVDLLTGSSDVDGDALTAVNLTLNSGSGNLVDSGNGDWTFSPNTGWNGAVSFTFDISDSTTTNANTASLTVGAVNDTPVVDSNSYDNGDTTNTTTTDPLIEDPDPIEEEETEPDNLNLNQDDPAEDTLLDEEPQGFEDDMNP